MLRHLACCSLMLALTSPLVAQPVGPLTWTFDETTQGLDVQFVSPTAVNPGASLYNTTLDLTTVEVGISYLGIPFGTVNVTSLVPPEFISSQEAILGPAPVQVGQSVVFPGPPTAPAVSADVLVGLDAAGFGTVTVSNIFLGQLSLSLPPFGVVTVDITSLRVAGALTIHATWFNVGGGVAGSLGVPQLVATGRLEPASPVALAVLGGAPLAPLFLVYSPNFLGIPFRGGTLVPAPDFLFVAALDASGNLVLGSALPATVPSQLTFYVQGWIPDAGAPAGLAGTPALQAHTP